MNTNPFPVRRGKNTCYDKTLRCYFCSKNQSIEKVNFPEDLFDLIYRYQIEQLLWTCDDCMKIISNRRIIEIQRPRIYHPDFEKLGYPNSKFSGFRELDTLCGDESENKMVDGKRVDVNDKEKRYSRSRSQSPNENSQSMLSSTSRSPSPPGSSKKDKSALRHLNSILKEIKISPDEDSNSRSIVTRMMEKLITKLKENSKIGFLVNRYYHTGSAFNDLRITSATEFDVDLVLKMPKNFNIKPDFLDAAFVKLKWDGVAIEDLHTNFIKLLNNVSCDSYLSPQKIISWLQCEMDLISTQELESIQGVLKVKYSGSGPARTIIVDTEFGYPISIDVVPVFEFQYSVLYDSPFYDEYVLEILEKFQVDNKQFYAVPKGCIGESDILVADSKLCWRIDVPNAEKKILYKKECAKSVIKLLKIFRDKKNWKGLASYYLKMVVIWEIIKNPQQEYWNNYNMYQRLLDCFKQLSVYLKDQHLPHFITKNNLFYKFKASQCTDWSNYLEKNVIGPLEMNSENLKAIYN